MTGAETEDLIEASRPFLSKGGDQRIPKTIRPFLSESSGLEPVRDWLKGMLKEERREIGVDIKKKERKTPKADLDLARQRLRKLRGAS